MADKAQHGTRLKIAGLEQRYDNIQTHLGGEGKKGTQLPWRTGRNTARHSTLLGCNNNNNNINVTTLHRAAHQRVALSTTATTCKPEVRCGAVPCRANTPLGTQ